MMIETPFVYARTLEEYHELVAMLPRGDTGCYKYETGTNLECPKCESNQKCQYQIATDCSSASIAVCVDSGTTTTTSSGPNTGAIAGGVVGGVAFIAVLTYLAWRFLIKPRRAESSMMSTYDVGANPSQDSEKDGASRLTRRSSTHTVHSIASTVLTRASNIIQIAYIPGVTNRANPSSGGSLVPPVPPIPAQHTGGTRDSSNEDQHFFMPGDLRDSTYSGLSGYSDRASYATHASYAPRSSIASTIYGKQAQVMAPGQTGMRVKPSIVSVKGANGTPDITPPPVPHINFGKFGNRPDSTASAFSVGSTFLNTATVQARAQVVKVGGGLKTVEIGSKSDASSSKSAATSVSQLDTPVTLGAMTMMPNVSAPSITVTSDQGPFSDPPHTPTASLRPVAEAELEGDNVMRPQTRERATSPFGDEHATK
ncbi:unnamed protein product [Clonostachys byssicola]|uniref:Membrane anchor Opy2 N-terminal domain-containing protein n=1 Tax=Clonostachys byssicola TaxID=160290 RepID=A0A9N9UTB8_9HYPO|nr:unnamed protein product [Clonostachys byssicola]